MQSATTITFGDRAENHFGMQILGDLADYGFTIQELKDAKNNFEEIGCKCELIDLTQTLNKTNKNNAEDASLLIVRNAVDKILLKKNKTHKDMFMEHNRLKTDKKYFDMRRQTVLNKRARYNLCFGDKKQKANFNEGKGTIIPWSDVPITKYIRKKLKKLIGKKAKKLQGEGNYYYDPDKCGIGFHGDTERRLVVGIRLGHEIPFHFQWFRYYKPIGKRMKFELKSGDLYIMSDKATGYDWKTKNKLTLRHAAGCDKYTTIKKK